LGSERRDAAIVIPDKAFFRIGEVAEILDVKPYIIRYWESEFSQLHPEKSSGNQRVYSRNDVKLLLTIKTLLWDQKFTIEGARKQLSARKAAQAAEEAPKGDEVPLTAEQSSQAARTLFPAPQTPVNPSMKSFLTQLDDLTAENQKLRKRLEQSEAQAEDLDRKLTEERKMRTQLISYLQREFETVINLVDSHLDDAE
jgi:DNA-binding transcriptional MerR regulator